MALTMTWFTCITTIKEITYPFWLSDTSCLLGKDSEYSGGEIPIVRKKWLHEDINFSCGWGSNYIHLLKWTEELKAAVTVSPPATQQTLAWVWKWRCSHLLVLWEKRCRDSSHTDQPWSLPFLINNKVFLLPLKKNLKHIFSDTHNQNVTVKLT